MVEMKPIHIPNSFNYIAAFLTFSCQLRCSYCINHHGGDLLKGRWMNGKEWIKGLNRIKTRKDLPITIQGGEPTVHRNFFDIVNGIDEKIPIDLLTNLEISAEKFMHNIRPSRLKREAPYASIRVSYHHGQSKFEELMVKVQVLQKAGYHIGVWEVNHPEYVGAVLMRAHIARHMGIDYRIKSFLGPWKGKDYGKMKYKNAVNANRLRYCECRTSELLIAPDGKIYRCTSDLYAGRCSIGHLLDEEPPKLGEWRECHVYGKCNSCDIKIKNNRFQEFGHSSVEIRNLGLGSRPALPVKDVVNTYGKI